MLRSAATTSLRVPSRNATTSSLRSNYSRQLVYPPTQISHTFSTKTISLQQQRPPNKSHQSSQPPNGEPEIPKFSLDGLGISPKMKKVIIGVICIFGTMETYTYYIWIKNRWFPDEEVGEGFSPK